MLPALAGQKNFLRRKITGARERDTNSFVQSLLTHIRVRSASVSLDSPSSLACFLFVEKFPRQGET